MITTIEKEFEKGPNEVLDFKFDWSDWLGSDTISTSSWVVPNGITKDSDTNDTTSTTIWLSGGVLGNKYTVLNRIQTGNSPTRVADRSAYIKMVTK